MLETNLEESRYVGVTLSEFLDTMQMLSGWSKREGADFIGVGEGRIHEWQAFKFTPPFGGKNAKKIQDAFGLTPTELRGLIEGQRAVVRGEEPRIGVTVETGLPNITAENCTQVFLGAFALRAESGPPLSAPEAALVRFLVQHATDVQGLVAADSSQE